MKRRSRYLNRKRANAHAESTATTTDNRAPIIATKNPLKIKRPNVTSDHASTKFDHCTSDPINDGIAEKISASGLSAENTIQMQGKVKMRATIDMARGLSHTLTAVTF